MAAVKTTDMCVCVDSGHSSYVHKTYTHYTAPTLLQREGLTGEYLQVEGDASNGHTDDNTVWPAGRLEGTQVLLWYRPIGLDPPHAVVRCSCILQRIESGL